MPSLLFRLFGLEKPQDYLLESQDVKVQRECCIPYGHIDQEGRLDLVARVGSRAIIVVEAKRGPAEAADTAKNEGYNLWPQQQSAVHRYSVILATSAEEEIYSDFRFFAWADLCIEMRLLAIDLCKEKPPRLTSAAMVLAFVAAVEQNLIGFSAGLVRSVCDGHTVFFNSKVVDHLKRFVDKLEG
jgi:hypothetical protein